MTLSCPSALAAATRASMPPMAAADLAVLPAGRVLFDEPELVHPAASRIDPAAAAAVTIAFDARKVTLPCLPGDNGASMGILANPAGSIALLPPSEDRQGGKQAVDVGVAALQVPLPWPGPTSADGPMPADGPIPAAGAANAVRACRIRVLSKIRQSPGASRSVRRNSGRPSSDAHARYAA